MDAALIAVGSELLRPGRRETNSEWLAERLERLGIEVRWKGVVVDDVSKIASLVSVAVGHVGVVLTTGGLGPTEDDRTREALALAYEVDLVRDPVMLQRLETRSRGLGRTLSLDQARQADRPQTSNWLENSVGSAPGLTLERDRTLVFALPGVPAEMKAMFATSVEPVLRAGGERSIARRTLRIAGRTESAIDRRVRDLYATEGAEVTILASPSGIDLVMRVLGRTAAEANDRLAALEVAMGQRLGTDLFGRDEQTLPGVVGEALRSAGRTLATAESCTAGLLAATVTEVPGASAWFRGGLIVYDDELKVRLAGVRPETLAVHGAVSPPVAKELAIGARARCGADFGIGITGIAGPSGGSAGKPVGLVHVALDTCGTVHEARLQFSGDREFVRRRTVTAALDLLRRHLLEPS